MHMHQINAYLEVLLLFFLPATHAIGGWLLVWNMRDDETEKFLGIVLKRNAWQVITVAIDAALMWFYAPLHLIENWRVAVAAGLAFFIWNYAHGPMLSPPWQPCSSTPDIIEKALMALFKKKPGDRMGWVMWSVYRVVRYVLPCIGIDLCLGYSGWYAFPVVGTVFGLMICFWYWPLAYWLTEVPRTKFVGAGGAGAMFHAMLFIGGVLT